MGGEGVSERVWRHGLLDAGLVAVLPQDLPRAHARQRLTASVEEEHALALPLLEFTALLAQGDGYRRDRASAHGNEPLLGPLLEDDDVLGLQHDATNAH